MISPSIDVFRTRLMILYARPNWQSREYEPSTINRCRIEHKVDSRTCRGNVRRLNIDRSKVLMNRARSIALENCSRNRMTSFSFVGIEELITLRKSSKNSMENIDQLSNDATKRFNQ